MIERTIRTGDDRVKEKKMYECEFCNAVYPDEEKAQKCEKNHKTLKKCEVSRWLPIDESWTGFPETVKVTFDDGQYAFYKRI